MDSFSNIAVVGLGYIGLPTAAIFAANGVEVVGIDTNPHVVETINAGKPHFGEPNLDALVRRVVEGGKLRASLTMAPADAFIIAVPTPLRGHGGEHDAQPDITYIEAAARAVAPVLAAGNLVILESSINRSISNNDDDNQQLSMATLKSTINKRKIPGTNDCIENSQEQQQNGNYGPKRLCTTNGQHHQQIQQV